MATQDNEYQQLVNEILNCRKCKLYASRKNPVVGEGPLTAKVMFVGEAPGKQEDETGRPFVGAAGKLLTRLIEELLGIKRSEVYITNIVKCRPPGNRDPEPDEIEACTPYLWRQIRIIKPRVIIALGRHAGRVLLERMGYRWTSLKAHRGRVYRGIIEGVEVSVVVTYHPAAALYNPSLRSELEKDFSTIIKHVVDAAYGKSELKFAQRTLLDFLANKR